MLWRARWVTAAVLVGCACAAVVDALQPAPPPSVRLVVTTHDVAAGHPLDASDVQVVAMPPDLAPPHGITDPADVIGSAPAIPLPEGLPLVDGLLARTLAHGPPGTVVVPVRFADDGVARLLGPGLHVDVLAATDDGAPGRYLAHRALVLPAPVTTDGSAATGSRSSLLGSAPTSTDVPPVLLAVAPDEAAAITGAATSAALGAVVVE